jgi:DNA-binding response OmpR family regulator
MRKTEPLQGKIKMRKLEYYRLLAELKILLIEPDPFLKDALQKAFGNIGCFVDVAGSAEEGFGMLDMKEFDIIMADIDLPGIDGLEFFIRAGSQCRRALKVVIAGYGDIDPVSTASEFGIDQIFEKPFALTTVLDALTGHFRALQQRMRRTG